MAIEGSVTSWVSHHRRHHVYADLPGDPHSPFHYGTGFVPQLRGLLHAHVAWLYSGMASDPQRWSRDLLADRDIVRVSSLTPLWMTMSLALPFGIGWAVTRTLSGALLALLWAGAVRIAVLQHVTWSVNSLGHMFGKRPFKTRDESRNLAILALVSFGDGWHNAHHAFPALARHGVDRGQLDSSAMIIRVFELLGWAWRVRWPTTKQLATRRVA
jgi:stearoyl-CoA desaturase (delta-9 desaturase)